MRGPLKVAHREFYAQERRLRRNPVAERALMDAVYS